MKTNVGSYDAGVRFVLGCVILEIGAHSLSWWGALGLVPILSAAFAFCPLYVPFHLNTTACDEPHPHHGDDHSEKV